METPTDTARVQRRNRLQMVAIMSIALVTLGASYALFYFAKTSGGWGTTNNGEFVQPAVNISDLGWQQAEPGSAWWVWILADDCTGACPQTVKDMRALHILLNKESDRVQRGFTSLQGAELSDLLAQYPGMQRVSLATDGGLAPGVFIIDPLGNLVFRYEMDVDPKLILQDLKKLLKLSQIG